MSHLAALFLGLIQGVTEFLPVSSSGHLALAQAMLGLEGLDKLILFDLVCHLGTLIALLALLWRDLLEALTRRRFSLLLLILGSLPLLFLLPLHGLIKRLYDMPQLLGFFFLITALLIYLGEKMGRDQQPIITRKSRMLGALAVGSCQAFAVLPGVSRSGATISCARALGWERSEAARFSFLLAIPAIVGGMVLETASYLKRGGDLATVPFSCYLIAFAAAFVSGLGALSLLLRLIKRRGLTPFAVYCFALGLITLLVCNC